MNPCIAKDYIESCLKIKTKSGTVVPFRLNDAQRKLYAVAKRQQDAGKPVRLIILKARQLGFSTLTEGLIFHLPGKQEIINEWQQKFAVPAMATSAGGDGAGALGEAAAGGAIPGAQTLPLLGGAPTA